MNVAVQVDNSVRMDKSDNLEEYDDFAQELRKV